MQTNMNSFQQAAHLKNNQAYKRSIANQQKQEGKTPTPFRQKNSEMLASAQASPFLTKINNNYQELSPFRTHQSVQLQDPTLHENANSMGYASYFKQNTATNGIKSPISKRGPFTKKDEFRGPLTPKSRLHTQLQSIFDANESQRMFNKNKQSSQLIRTDTDLEGIISFKSLIENRCKTSTNASIASKTNKPEKSHFNFEGIFTKEAGMNKEKGNPQLKCRNNDGKMAKYRVISRDSFLDDELYYCSKCTITLVQQGFILEEITKEVSSSKTNDFKENILSKLQFERHRYTKIVNQMNKSHLADLQRVQDYYHDLADVLTQYQSQDICQIQEYYLKKEQQLDQKLKSINTQIAEVQNDLLGRQMECDLEKYMTDQQQNYELKICIDEGLVTIFKEIFQEQFRPNLNVLTAHETETKKGISYKSTEPQMLSSVDRNEALRFSFEALLFQKCGKKKKMQSLVDLTEQQKQDEQQLNINSCQSPAFRDLFGCDSLRVSGEVSSPVFKNI